MNKQEIIDYMYENHVQGDFKIEEMAEDLSQKTGKWILDNPRSDDSLIYRYACSECHAHHRARYDFCPSCGADMRGGDA